MPQFLGMDYSLPAAMSSEDRVQVNSSLNLRQTAIKRPGQRFRMFTTLIPNKQNDFGKLSAHKTYHSYDKVFNVEVLVPEEQEAIDALPHQTLSPGATLRQFRVPVAFTTFQDALGRFVLFEGRAKLYQIVDVSEVTGNANASDIIMEPPVQFSDFPSDTPVVLQLNDVTMRCRYDPEVDLSETMSADGIHRGEITVVEAI